MICALILLYLVIKRITKRESTGCVIYAVTIWTLYIYAVTEILSVFHSVCFITLFFAWLILDVILMICLTRIHIHTENPNEIVINKNGILRTIILIIFGCAVTYLSIKIVPYNMDSMAYHLGRIANWAQNRSVAHYASSILRQVCSPVLAEFVNLNIYVLMQGNDIFFNLLQSFSYLLNIYLVYKIAERIGCDKGGTLFAAILFATSPTCFAEALSTQVDEFAALWLLAYVYLILDVVYDSEKIKIQRETVFRILIIAQIISFGYLTKPTVILAMVVFAVWMVIKSALRKDDRKSILTWCISVPFTSFVIIMPELIRNIITFHSVSSKMAGKAQMVGSLDPRYIFVGMLKNMFHNLPSVYWPWMKKFVQDIVYWSAYHLGINADSEAISEGAGSYVLQTPPDYTYDTSINPVISALFFLCILFFIILRIYDHHKKRRYVLSYSTVAFSSFVMLCMTARWEPYVSRYMVPYFAILSPAIALQIQKFFSRIVVPERRVYFRGCFTGMVYFMCVIDMIGMLSYHAKQAFKYNERNEGYFEYGRNAQYEYDKEIAKIIKQKQFTKIGLDFGEGAYEYPFWQIVWNSDLLFEHVNVKNETEKYEDEDFIPDCIVINESYYKGKVYKCHGKEYHHTYKIDDNYILITP